MPHIPQIPRLPLIPDRFRRIDLPDDLAAVTAIGDEDRPEAGGLTPQAYLLGEIVQRLAGTDMRALSDRDGAIGVVPSAEMAARYPLALRP